MGLSRVAAAVAVLLAASGSAAAGELWPIFAEYTCGAGSGRFELYFAYQQEKNEISAYRVAKNRSIAIMPTGVRYRDGFDIDAQALKFNDSVCDFSFAKGTLTKLSCDEQRKPLPPIKCVLNKTIKPM